MKRQRGRGRGNKPGNQSNRSFESNGPDVKIRGNAAHVHEKYLQLARDASSSGDRILAENYHQHAEHYFRIVQANQPRRDENDGDDQRGAQQNPNQNRNDDRRDGGRDNRRDDNRDRSDNRDSRDRNDGRDNRDSSRDQGGSDGQDEEGRSRRGRGRRRRDDDQNQNGEQARDPLEVVNLEGGEEQAQPQAEPPAEEAPKPRRARAPRKPKADKDAQAALDAAGDGDSSDAAA